VLDAIGQRFHVPEHHRGRAGQSLAVRHVHHAHPFGRHSLQRSDALANPIHENLPAAPRQRTQSGPGKVPHDLFDRLVKEFLEGEQLARAESMDVDLREAAANVGQQIQVPLFGQLGMMPALHQNLRAPEGDRFLNLAIQFLPRDDVGIVILFRAIEGAEFTIDVANVGVVDVAVDNVGDDLRPAPAIGTLPGEDSPPIGQRAQLVERQAGQAQGLGGIDAPSRPDLLQKLIQ
jgi:hypothetical protein